MLKRKIQESTEWAITYPVSATDVCKWFDDAPLEDAEKALKRATQIIDMRHNEPDDRTRTQGWTRFDGKERDLGYAGKEEPTHKITHIDKMKVRKSLRRRSSGG